MWDFTRKQTYTFRGYYIPPRMMDGIQRYIENHIKPGSFLSAVIQNNLKEACSYADDENLANLPAYVGFFYNQAPGQCWGSEENFKRWLNQKGD